MDTFSGITELQNHCPERECIFRDSKSLNSICQLFAQQILGEVSVSEDK